MSAHIEALRRLLNIQQATTGKVIKVDERGYHVATSKGVQVCVNSTSTAFKNGDTVRVVEGAILGGIIDESSLPTFQV